MAHWYCCRGVSARICSTDNSDQCKVDR